MRTLGSLLLLAFLCTACGPGPDNPGDGDVDCDHAGGPAVYDEFESPTFQAVWVQQGPGTVEFAAGAGSTGNGLRLDSTGVACELRTDPLGADHVGMYAFIDIAIDPTAGSGAQGTFAVLDVAGIVLASLTVRENFIDYELPGLAPQSFAWATDGQFHRFRFYSSHGYATATSRWERDGAITFAGGLPVTDLQVRFSIGGTSPADVFFDQMDSRFLDDCPAA